MCWNPESILKNKQDFLATVWLAGSANKNVPKHSSLDINSVPISSTCIRLLDVCSIRNRMDNNAKNVLAHTSDIPPLHFRHLAKLYIGTLRIYQQQVNCLLELSHHLVQKSKYCVLSLPNSLGKRKCAMNNKSSPELKKCCKNDSGFISSYDELLHEVETLQNWSKLQSQDINKQLKLSVSNRRTLTLVQIREITIPEFSNDLNYDIDEGFGNATADEVEDLLNFNHDLNNSVTSAVNILKRRIPLDHSNIDCMLRKRKSMEEAHYSSILYDTIEEQRDTQNFISEEPIVLPTPLCVSRRGSESSHYKSLPTSTVNQISTRNQIASWTSGKNNRKIFKKRSKLVIDKHKKLSIDAIESNFLNYSNLQYRSCITLPRKKKHTAKVLLSKLCRNIKHSMPIKFKQILSPLKSNEEYMSIITAIFDDSDVKLASTIYPKWQQEVKPNNIRPLRPQENVENDLNNNASEVIPAGDMSIGKSQHDDNMKSYGVMMELLDILRNSYKSEIDANFFCQCAKNRIQSAAKFYSLLALAAKKSIVLKHKENSIEIGVIQLGPTISETCLHNVKDAM